MIICEGSKTEPNYFGMLKNIAIDNKIWTFIEIFPIPILDERETYQPNNRKRRSFKPNVEEDNRYKSYLHDIYPLKEAKVIYSATSQTPLRYVKEAQIRLEEEGFDEAWAVFDKDEHPATKKASELQNKVNGDFGVEKLKIAFSSRSFEYWIILHYQKQNLAFDKTECKEKIDNNDIFYDCGQANTNPKNCKGNSCLVGYIRQYCYPDFAKSQLQKEFTKMMSELLSKNDFAHENAAWLRFQMKKKYPKIPIYELNPYTDVDKLVKSMLGITKNYLWAEFDRLIKSFAGLRNIRLLKKNATQIEFYAEKINLNPQTNIACFLKDKDRNIETLQILEAFGEAEKNKKFTIEIPPSSSNKDLCIEIEDSILLLEL